MAGYRRASLIGFNVLSPGEDATRSCWGWSSRVSAYRHAWGEELSTAY